MTIKTQLNDSMKDAMKSGDEVRKRTVRMVLAAVKQAEVDKRSNPADKRIELEDLAITNIIQKEVKNRRESLEEATKANRADLVEANEAEIKVLETFLPKAMPAEELRAMTAFYRSPVGAKMLQTMPQIMGESMQISQRVVMPRMMAMIEKLAQGKK